MRIKQQHIKPIMDDLNFIGTEEKNETALRVLVTFSLAGVDEEDMNPFAQAMFFNAFEDQMEEVERLGEWWKSFKKRYEG